MCSYEDSDDEIYNYLYSQDYQKYKNQPLRVDINNICWKQKETKQFLETLDCNVLDDEMKSIRAKMTNVGEEYNENMYVQLINSVKFKGFSYKKAFESVVSMMKYHKDIIVVSTNYLDSVVVLQSINKMKWSCKLVNDKNEPTWVCDWIGDCMKSHIQHQHVLERGIQCFVDAFWRAFVY